MTALCTLPSIHELAKTALRAHELGKLQATSPFKSEAASRCMYYDPATRTTCVIGAGIPRSVAKRFDDVTNNTVVDLYDAGLLKLADDTQLEKFRYLQQLHDRAFGNENDKAKLVQTLRRYAAVLLLALLLPAAAHAQSSGFSIAPNGQITTSGQGTVRSWGPEGSMLVTPGGGYWCCGSAGWGTVGPGAAGLNLPTPGGQLFVPAVPAIPEEVPSE